MDWLHRRLSDIEDRLARGADQMMMRGHVRFEAQRAVVKRYFLEDAGIEELFYVLVDRAQGDRWDAPPDLLVDHFRSRMFVRIYNGFVYNLALESESEALCLTTPSEVVESSRTQV